MLDPPIPGPIPIPFLRPVLRAWNGEEVHPVARMDEFGGKRLKVLLVAPRTELLLADQEVEDVIRSGLAVTPKLGRVTSGDLLREIRNGKYDVLWLATHGNSEGVHLSDGLLTTSELVAQVRERFSLVVLNTCSSLLVAQQIQEDAEVGVICTIIDVPDRLAYQTGSLLASALVDAPNTASAYRRSRPGGNRIYLYLAALSASQDIIESLVKEITGLKERIERQASQIERQAIQIERQASQLEGQAVQIQRQARYMMLSIVLTVSLHSLTWILAWILMARGGL